MLVARRVCVLTVSDRCSAGLTDDTAGPAVADLVREKLRWEVAEAALVPDEPSQISARLVEWADAGRGDLLLTVGGTGFSPRDVTPEATLAIVDRRASSLMELARLRCFAKTPKAFLSRGDAGIRGRSLIVNLPGSRRGSVETLEALLDVLPHAISTLVGERSHAPDGRERQGSAA